MAAYTSFGAMERDLTSWLPPQDTRAVLDGRQTAPESGSQTRKTRSSGRCRQMDLICTRCSRPGNPRSIHTMDGGLRAVDITFFQTGRSGCLTAGADYFGGPPISRFK